MAWDERRVQHGEAALRALRAAIQQLQGDDRLHPVTVVVPSNAVGVAARRWLARHGGIAAVQFLTIFRLAELRGGRVLTAQGRRPVSSPVVDLAVRSCLARRGGSLRPVAHHRDTVDAIRHTYAELRQLDTADLDTLRGHASRRGRDVVAVADAVREQLVTDWYDERDLLDATVDQLPVLDVVVHLPAPFTPSEERLLRRIAQDGQVIVLHPDTDDTSHPLPGIEVVSVTDADEEATEAVRQILAACGQGTALDEIAVVWPTPTPYARVLSDHLDRAEIAWNGIGGSDLAERLAPRLALGWLRLDRRGLRRVDLFALLAQVPAHRADGTRVPTAHFERISRRAGVHGGGDWRLKLERFAARHGDSNDARLAGELADFVDDLIGALGPPDERRQPSDWASRLDRLVDGWLRPRSPRTQLPAGETSALETLERITLRLRGLDPLVPGGLTRAEFADLLEGELDRAPSRVGRIGHGVHVGPVSFAVGQRWQLLIVLGGADGVLPAPPPVPGVLADRDRALVAPRLELTGDRPARQRVELLAALAGTDRAVVCVPRGDLRATARRSPSRLIAELAGRTDITAADRASAAATLLSAEPAPTVGAHRVRHLVAARAAGVPLDRVPLVGRHAALHRGVALLAARASDRFTEYDGYLPDLAEVLFPRVVSPSSLERWSACPWQAFVQDVLGVRAIEDPALSDSISAADRGSLVHDVLDALHRQVLDGLLAPPVDGWTDVHATFLRDTFHRLADDAEQRGITGRRALWQRDRAVVARLLDAWLEDDSALLVARHARLAASEQWLPDDGSADVTTASGRRIEVRGKVDRIDVTDDRVIVTDHKTGRVRKLSHDDPTAAGTNLQLLLYAMAAPALVGRPSDHLVEVEYSFVAERKRRSLLVDADVRAELARQLDRIVGGMERGVWVATPERPSAFTGWIRCPMCDPDGLGTASAHRTMQRKRGDQRVAEFLTGEQDAE